MRGLRCISAASQRPKAQFAFNRANVDTPPAIVQIDQTERSLLLHIVALSVLDVSLPPCGTCPGIWAKGG